MAMKGYSFHPEVKPAEIWERQQDIRNSPVRVMSADHAMSTGMRDSQTLFYQ